ncbi:MAG: hypothetical protein IKE60_23965 [Reyranella sp.]|uniref:hypothetical protein n=1 Tax=Reyranella sp. TaxID=1929291 RepID=UPI0025E1726D|nr:hypothetical protein [Reyranella sp.]MBR2817738.1 hypothetical protein [Reyranella sp.]
MVTGTTLVDPRITSDHRRVKDGQRNVISDCRTKPRRTMMGKDRRAGGLRQASDMRGDARFHLGKIIWGLGTPRHHVAFSRRGKGVAVGAMVKESKRCGETSSLPRRLLEKISMLNC